MMSDDISTRDGFSRRLAGLSEELVVFSRRLVDSEDDAEDVLQAAFASAWRHRHRFAEGTNFRAWIYTFVVNEGRNANRRRSRARARTTRLDGDSELSRGDFWERLDADMAYREALEGSPSLLDRLDGRLAASLRAVSFEERTVLLLRAIGGLTCAEIAALLDVPKGTVMARLFRVRARIREMLAAGRDPAGGESAGRDAAAERRIRFR